MNLTAPLKLSEPPDEAGAERRRVAAALTFRRSGRRSFLARQYTPHPFHITRPFHLDGDPDGMATLYLQSSSGGLYGDDDLSLQIGVGQGASAHVTTQASTIVHAGRGGTTRHDVEIACAQDSLLEYLPDPLILFADASLRGSLLVEVDRGASLIFSDSFLVHDPKHRDTAFALFENDIEIRRKGEARPILIDRMRLSRSSWPPAALENAGRYACHGSLCLLFDGAGNDAASAIKRSLTDAGLERPACYSGVNPLPDRGLVWARFLCRDGVSLSKALKAAWRGARVALTGRAPPVRKK